MADAAAPFDLMSLLNTLRGARPPALPAAAGSLPPNVLRYMQTAPSVGDGEGHVEYGLGQEKTADQMPTISGWPVPNAGDPMPIVTGTAPQAPAPDIQYNWQRTGQIGQNPPQAISDLLTTLRSSPSMAPLLARIGGAPTAPPAASQPPGAAADYARRGFIDATPYLNPAVAPRVPQGAARPLGPGEYVRNPDGSWSSEESTTVGPGENLGLMGGKATVIPTLWVKDGKPYMANEDEAQQLAVQSGLSFPTFDDMKAADAFATQREAIWEKTPMGQSNAQAPLWTYPAAAEYVEPPPSRTGP